VLRGAEPDAMSPARIVTTRTNLPEDVKQNAPTLDEQLDEARRLGFDAGRRAALEDAALRADEARATASKLSAERLMELSSAVAANRQAMADEIVSEYVDLAFDLVRVLLDDELALRDDATQRSVARALRLAPPDEEIVVRVHPNAGLSASELNELTAGCPISIREDASIEPGGCIIEAGASRIDAQADTALERVRTELAKLRHADRAHHAKHPVGAGNLATLAGVGGSAVAS
jgi:flagellar assembly protein FliH